jgi:hypothetical protein
VIHATLKEINSWYDEPAPAAVHRPKLLSKLATLELCGWLEGEFDKIILNVQDGRLNDSDWVRVEILSRTNGFRYTEDLRAMLTKIVGEVFVRRVEEKMEQKHPRELERLKSLLGYLWKVRCSFAHADVAANIASQQKFEAPSWTLNQYKVLLKLVGYYEDSVNETLHGI